MENLGSIHSFKKHGTNIFQMKWGNSAKEWEQWNNGIGKILEGTNTFYVIKFEDIPKYWLNEICYTSLVCELRPGKKDPNRKRITIYGTNVFYPGYIGTNTASLELFKLIIVSILSRAGAKYVCFDIENFYLSTPLGIPEYVKIQLSKIPQEFIK